VIPIALGINASSKPEVNASLRRHIAEFEGMLLSQVMEKLKDAYHMPGAEETDSTGESFQSLANSALGNSLASRGGLLGLTNLLIQSFTGNRPIPDVEKLTSSADPLPESGGKH
jgi:Rod binding domain-containing protein